MSFLTCKKNLPYLGVGLGCRDALLPDILTHRESIDWLELVPENYMGRQGLHLEKLEWLLEADFPLVSHGVSLSIGSAPMAGELHGLDPVYLNELEAFLHKIEAPWFSDHLSFSRVNGQYLNELLALPHTQEAADIVVRNIHVLQQHIQQPFLLENISYYLRPYAQDMSEAQWITTIVEAADCGLMLDINNVYVNSKNLNQDPIAFLDQLPLERVVQVHIAGHFKQEDFIIDTHGAPVCEEVYALFEALMERCEPLAVLLERDNDFPPFQDLLAELEQIRCLMPHYQKRLNLRP
jgi:uncharacterized protein